MSERYTPEQMREWADSPNSSHSTAAMLRQAATDAEALAAKDKEIARLALESKNRGIIAGLNQQTYAEDIEKRDVEIARLTGERDEWKNIASVNGSNGLTAATLLTAERQKVRELREYLDNEIVVAIKCDEQSANTTDANWFRGKAEGYAWAVKCMDTLGLTRRRDGGQYEAMTSDTKHRALPLSELIKRIGDDHVECHPLFDCMSNIRVVKGGGNKITLNIVTDKITPGDVACREAKYTGFVILFPIDKCLDARESWDNEEPSTTRDRFTGDTPEGQG